MKIYILTSVALLAEYGDLDSLDTPSVNTQVFLSKQKAKTRMEEELKNESKEATAQGYENVETEISENTAFYQQGKPGDGCSKNQVQWEISEITINPRVEKLRKDTAEKLKEIVKNYGETQTNGETTLNLKSRYVYING